MHRISRKAARRQISAALSIVAALLVASPCTAADMEMPNAAEVQYFSPEAQQFYAAGVAALDKADYNNAYNMLAKAGALQPASVRLNHLVAQLAMYQGRQNTADEATDYYQTAIASYENILNVPTIGTDMRITVTNQLKIALQEASTLAQRDAMREATGTTFILDYNRRYATQTPRAAGLLDEMASVTTQTQTVEANPIAAMMMQDATMGAGMGMDPAMGMMGMGGDPGMGMNPGMPMDPSMPMPGGPGGMPGAPGAFPNDPSMPMPGGPGAMPGQPQAF